MIIFVHYADDAAFFWQKLGLKYSKKSAWIFLWKFLGSHQNTVAKNKSFNIEDSRNIQKRKKFLIQNWNEIIGGELFVLHFGAIIHQNLFYQVEKKLRKWLVDSKFRQPIKPRSIKKQWFSRKAIVLIQFRYHLGLKLNWNKIKLCKYWVSANYWK